MKYLDPQKKVSRVSPRLILGGAAGLLGAGLVATLFVGLVTEKPLPKSEVVSESPIHWHPVLSIYVKGEKIPTPNLGMVPGQSGPHTHDSSGKLHWELAGPVTRSDLRLGAIFKIWDEVFNSHQLFTLTNGPRGTIGMTVNGKSNTEFDNYHIHDNDKIEIRYE